MLPFVMGIRHSSVIEKYSQWNSFTTNLKGNAELPCYLTQSTQILNVLVFKIISAVMRCFFVRLIAVYFCHCLGQFSKLHYRNQGI